MTKSHSCLFRFLLMRAPPIFCHGWQIPVLMRPGLTVVLLCLCLVPGPGTSLAFDDYRPCPHRIAAPAGLRAQRGPGAEELSVRWDSLLPGNRPEAAVQVHVTAGHKTFVALAQANERSVSFESLPRGVDLFVEAALTAGEYVISDVVLLYIPAHRLRSRYAFVRPRFRPSASAAGDVGHPTESPVVSPLTLPQITTDPETGDPDPPPMKKLAPPTNVRSEFDLYKKVPYSQTNDDIMQSCSVQAGECGDPSKFRFEYDEKQGTPQRFEVRRCHSHTDEGGVVCDPPKTIDKDDRGGQGETGNQKGAVAYYQIRAVGDPEAGQENSDWVPVNHFD